MPLEELIGQEDGNKDESRAPTLPNQYQMTAESVTYDAACDIVTRDGNCILRRRSEMIAADRFQFDLGSGIAHARPHDDSRALVRFSAKPATVGLLALAGENQGL